jgi:hypothetical protein
MELALPLSFSSAFSTCLNGYTPPKLILAQALGWRSSAEESIAWVEKSA